jgi:four helix bundle protein
MGGLQKSKSYRDLEVWKLSIDLVKEIYLINDNFPPSVIYGLTNQIRRAAVSIPFNIAEGHRAEVFPKNLNNFWLFHWAQWLN